jgi:hypothetical protein
MTFGWRRIVEAKSSERYVVAQYGHPASDRRQLCFGELNHRNGCVSNPIEDIVLIDARRI